jgi:nucleoside-diphosphate-sugar epimerase
VRIVVLGGTGFIGPYVVRALFDRGHDVTIVHSGRHESDLLPDIQHVHGDWNGPADLAENLSNLASELTQLRPDVALYMTPNGEQDTRNVVATLRGKVRRLVAISSMDVYFAYDVLHGREPGPSDPAPLVEESQLRQQLYPHRSWPRRPDDPAHLAHDYDKILAERIVLGDSELPGTVLRLPMVYGPGDPYHRPFDVLKRMDDGRPALLIGNDSATWRVSRGYVENVAAAIALAVADDRATGRVYNVAEPDARSGAEWAQAIGTAARWQGQIISIAKDRLPAHLQDQLNRANPWVMDTTRIRQELGYSEPVDRETALRRTVAWERAHPPDPIDPAQFDYVAEDELLAQLEEESRGDAR